MSIKSRSILKGYFERKDKPTQAQFSDLIDSMFNLSDNTTDDITSGDYAYIGPVDTAGSWRIGRDGSNNLLFQYYNGSAWVDAFQINIPE